MQHENYVKNNLFWNINGREQLNWHDIDWVDVNRTVNRLRSRIFKAAKEKKLKNLRNLQSLMLSSSDNYLHSIRRVTFAKGRNTPGIDNVVVTTPKQRMEMFEQLNKEGINSFMPKPVRRIHLIKPDGSPRPIGIPTIKDRVIQAIVKNALEPEWESKFEPVSFGFRPKRSLHDAVAYARHILGQKKRPWVLEVDTAKCFDSIDHKYMLDKLEHFPARELIRRWLNAGILLNRAWLDTPSGTPQGGALSPLLCNITMQGLPDELGVKMDERSGKHRSTNKYAMAIYADDMVIFARTKQDCESCLDLVDSKLALRGLKLNRVKTKVTSAYDGFDFLGFNLRMATRFGKEKLNLKLVFTDNGTTLRNAPGSWFVAIAQPSSKAMASIKSKLKQAFLSNKAQKTLVLINTVNPIIRGWALNKKYWYYYPFAKILDNYLYNLQVRWMYRRHPNMGSDFRVKKYFALKIDRALGIRHKWTFYDKDTQKPMLKFSWFYDPIGKRKDWVKVAGNMCQDDYSPEAREYFKTRAQMMFDRKTIDLSGKTDQLIAKRQNLICPICKDSLFNDEALHRHHIRERSKGGSDSPSNLAFIHTACHYKLHYGKKKRELNLLLEGFSSSNTEGWVEQAVDQFGPVIDGFTDGPNPVAES